MAAMPERVCVISSLSLLSKASALLAQVHHSSTPEGIWGHKHFAAMCNCIYTHILSLSTSSLSSLLLLPSPSKMHSSQLRVLQRVSFPSMLHISTAYNLSSHDAADKSLPKKGMGPGCNLRSHTEPHASLVPLGSTALRDTFPNLTQMLAS